MEIFELLSKFVAGTKRNTPLFISHVISTLSSPFAATLQWRHERRISEDDTMSSLLFLLPHQSKRDAKQTPFWWSNPPVVWVFSDCNYFLFKSTETNWYLKPFYPNSFSKYWKFKHLWACKNWSKNCKCPPDFLIMATFMEIETS